MATGFTTSQTPFLTKAAFDETQPSGFNEKGQPIQPIIKVRKKRRIFVSKLKPQKKVYTELDRVIDNMGKII